MTPQHTVKIRINKQIVDVNCPPFASDRQLDLWLAEYLDHHPDSKIISRSWKSDPDAAA